MWQEIVGMTGPPVCRLLIFEDDLLAGSPVSASRCSAARISAIG